MVPKIKMVLDLSVTLHSSLHIVLAPKRQPEFELVLDFERCLPILALFNTFRFVLNIIVVFGCCFKCFCFKFFVRIIIFQNGLEEELSK